MTMLGYNFDKPTLSNLMSRVNDWNHVVCREIALNKIQYNCH